MNKGYVDLHTHSINSDGVYSREELIQKAYDCGIRYLAISDHNYIENIDYLRDLYKDMVLIQSVELSATYYNLEGKKCEIHILGLGVDINHPKMIDLIKRNQIERRPYIEQILAKLKLYNINIGTYDDLLKINHGRDNFGRSLIANEMVRYGYVKDVDEAFDIYLGAFNQRLAYVENPAHYVSFKEVIETIIECHGIPVLCHLYYYCFDNRNNQEVLRLFSLYTQHYGAIEAYYGAYTKHQRMQLLAYAKEYQLKLSCGSDYHGHKVSDTLLHRFKYEDVKELMEVIINEGSIFRY